MSEPKPAMDTSKEYFLQNQKPEVVVIQCSDNRFQSSFNLFINEKVSPKVGYDLISLPGCIQVLTVGELFPKLMNSLLRPLKFLIKLHHPKRVAIIMHEDCKWYEIFVPQLIRTSELMYQQQYKDMEQARKMLGELFSGIEVDLFYARISGDKIEFEKIKKDASVKNPENRGTYTRGLHP